MPEGSVEMKELSAKNSMSSDNVLQEQRCNEDAPQRRKQKIRSSETCSDHTGGEALWTEERMLPEANVKYQECRETLEMVMM